MNTQVVERRAEDKDRQYMTKAHVITREDIIRLWEKKEEKNRAAAAKKEAACLRKEVKKIVKKRTRKAIARLSLKNLVMRRSKAITQRVTFKSKEEYLTTDFDTSEEEIESSSEGEAHSTIPTRTSTTAIDDLVDSVSGLIIDPGTGLRKSLRHRKPAAHAPDVFR